MFSKFTPFNIEDYKEEVKKYYKERNMDLSNEFFRKFLETPTENTQPINFLDSLSDNIPKQTIKSLKIPEFKNSQNINFSIDALAGKAKSKLPLQVYEGKFGKEINTAAEEHGIDSLLMASVIKQESNFNPEVTSSAGAIGLTQLMPSTAKELGVNPFDIMQNIQGGTKYLSKMLSKFDGNLKQALAAYNAGPGTVNDFLYGTNKTGKNPRKIKTKDGIPPFKETQNYVEKVLNNYNLLKTKSSE